MSAKRRRRRPAAARPAAPRLGHDEVASKESKRERQVEAQRQRGRARRRARQISTLRTAGIFIAIIAVAGLGLASLLRSASAGDVPDGALAAAKAAGCGSIQTPEGSNPSRDHLGPGQTPSFASEPATAGSHDPAPLPPDPHVYTSPVPETQAVHNLEHAYVEIYYRADGPDALPQDVVAALTSLTNSEFKVIMAPHPSLAQGTSLALVAWNKLWECPASVTAKQATTIASGFIDAYRGTGNAPEPGAA